MPLFLRADCSFIIFRCNFFCTADKCATAPSLKGNEWSGLNCRGLPMKKWRKIKCLPFSSSGLRGLWCYGIKSFLCGGATLPCFEVFKAHKDPSIQIYKLIFELERCRPFEFVIRMKSRDLSRFIYERKPVCFF